MEVITPIWFGVDIGDRFAGALLRRPWLSVRLATLRLDGHRRRWVLRAGVTNRGILTARRCEGYWTVFDPKLTDIESATSVYWSPLKDDDHDFKDRALDTVDIEPHERRFCWAELPLNVHSADGTRETFFPSGHHVGTHAIAIIVQYGQFKSFDYIVLNMPDPFGSGGNLCEGTSVFDIGLAHGRTLKEFKRWWRLSRFIRNVDYHEYVRPT
jgi:hypothetical protein